MSNIVFLFGAGASRNALPIVNEIPGRLKIFIATVKSKVNMFGNTVYSDLQSLNKTKKDLFNEFISSAEWVLKLCETHASIDTAAKKLFLTGKTEQLNILKSILSAFIVSEQLNRNVDTRYDTFFASILQGNSVNLPKNIRIITWNYDYQFEMAYRQYYENTTVVGCRSVLNCISKFEYATPNDGGFMMFRLNGMASTQKYSEPGYLHLSEDFDHEINLQFIENCIRHYTICKYYRHQFHCSLSFAWEEQEPKNSIVTKTARGCMVASVLVCIGYSFPFFNREVDRKIIREMDGLKSIYIQDPNAESIITKFKSIRPDLKRDIFTPIKDTDQFFLPPEL